MSSNRSPVNIVAFMGVAGAGKTSLVRGVVSQLGQEASAIFADAYRSIAIGWPKYGDGGLSNEQKCDRWVQEGCPADGYGSWPLLIEHLHALKVGRSVTMPERMWGSPGCDGVNADGGEHEVRPARFIVMEDAWALRTESRPLVDLSIFVRVPLDVALARRLIRDVQQGEAVLPIVRQYLSIGRRYSQALEDAAAEADVVLDGTLPLDALIADATRTIREHLPTL